MNEMTLKDAVEEKEYIVRQIDTDDEELKTFLFSLGCYEGEPITVVSHLKDSCVVSIKDGRYNIDNQLADAILMDMICAADADKGGSAARNRGLLYITVSE